MSALKTLHKLASPILYKTGLYRNFWRGRNQQTPFSFVVVYHRVVAEGANSEVQFDIERGVSASVFEKQMQFLLRHFTPARASRIQSGIGSDIQFAVTLDDGYEDNYLVAAPILKKLGIPATFYVVSDFVGSDRLFWWEQVADLVRRSKRSQLDLQEVVPDLRQVDDAARVLPMRNQDERDRAYGPLCAAIRRGLHKDIPGQLQRAQQYFDVPLREQGRDYALMNWRQLGDLVSQGFEIGGHTATHCNVVGADEVLLQRELVDSIESIESQLDVPVESFAYPYGEYQSSSKLVDKLLAQTRCKVAFTSDPAVVGQATAANELPRTTLNRAYDFACAFNVQDALNKSHSVV